MGKMGAVVAVLACSPAARADATIVNFFLPLEAPAPALPTTPAKLMPFGPSPAPRVALFTSIRVARPADIPPPKPAKGLSLVFDW